MKCFGEFEMDTFQIKFLEFLIYEIFDSMELNSLAFSGSGRYVVSRPAAHPTTYNR